MKDLEECIWKDNMNRDDNEEDEELGELTKECVDQCGTCDGYNYNCDCYRPLAQLPRYKI